jgi:iron(III) transport system ATP-binding protein
MAVRDETRPASGLENGAIQGAAQEFADEAPFVSIRRLTKSFGAFQALASIDLDVKQGEFVSFLGPSGCGKTTLLRAIAGLDRQTSGTIHINGRDVSNAPPSERDFGIVFQSYALFPNLTIADNVGYGLVNQRKSRSEIAARVGELLEMVGLSGQLRRAAAARGAGAGACDIARPPVAR